MNAERVAMLEAEKLTARSKPHEGTDSESGSDSEYSTSSDDDSDADMLTPEVDAALLRVLARIESKDPTIYSSSGNVFEEERKKVSNSHPGGKFEKREKSRKSEKKAMSLAAYQREALLDGRIHGEDAPLELAPTHWQEETALKNELRDAFHSAAAVKDGEDENGWMLTKKSEEAKVDENQYEKYLKSAVPDAEQVLGSLTGGKTATGASGDGKLSENVRQKQKEQDEKFLLNYILNRGWLEKGEVSDGKGQSWKPLDEDADIDAEDAFEDKNDKFEAAWNFRYEEPGANEIITYPRVIEDSVRRVDDRRKVARAEKKARLAAEREQQEQKIRQEKNKKLKEMREELSKLGVNVPEDDDGAWDEDEHERMMRIAVGPEEDDIQPDYSDAEVADDMEVEEQIASTSEATEVTPKADSKAARKAAKKAAKAAEQSAAKQTGTLEMDADHLPASKEKIDWSTVAEPASQAERKALIARYMDEIYGLDYNDTVGGIKTRFKYESVPAEDFGLTAEEILLGNDDELNEIVPLKALAPFRPKQMVARTKWHSREKVSQYRRMIEKNGRRWDAHSKEIVEDNKTETKKRAREPATEDGAKKPSKKRKGRKERKQNKAAETIADQP